MSKASIHFVCIAAEHGAGSKSNTHSSPFTIHEGWWSYCPAGLVTGHEWRAIAPTSHEELKRHVREPART